METFLNILKSLLRNTFDSRVLCLRAKFYPEQVFVYISTDERVFSLLFFFLLKVVYDFS